MRKYKKVNKNLINEMLEKGIKPMDIARLLKIDHQIVWYYKGKQEKALAKVSQKV